MSFRGGSRGGFRGSDRGGRGGGFSRGGGRGGGFQSSYGPPAQVLEIGTFMHPSEGDMVCESTNAKIPFFNAPIYLENKTQIGKIDEILGPINQVYFTIKPQDGIQSTSFKSGDKFFIGDSYRNQKFQEQARSERQDNKAEATHEVDEVHPEEAVELLEVGVAALLAVAVARLVVDGAHQEEAEEDHLADEVAVVELREVEDEDTKVSVFSTLRHASGVQGARRDTLGLV
ncbi:H/ACA ribonucleoprotein complex subunit 1 [Cyphellophora attinorum]|uniref:H/ACA ribonucleoprotein complex subunit n=1 Tax=Cyphellophora attinorum TaxID=1664694 RepID=A0A0N0NJT9_9EURO|nr:H/ACA ribonucleoprotein complex subunit 1 [Phialophora attinorum]KPI37278.1 H/ACA ribonucleoprotein complex subunit 1 [Phialophora attinorum]